MADDIQKARLDAYVAAEIKALNSQEYQDGNVKNRRADLGDISSGINKLLASGAGNTSSCGRSKRVILRDT